MNVRGTPAMSQPRVKHDVRKAAQHADLIGWQEMSRDRYINAIKQLDPGGVHRMPGHSNDIYAGKHWSHYMPKVGHGNVEVPISWNNDKFKFENKPGNCGTILLNKGTHKPGFNNPNRYATWVKLTDRKTGETFIRINAHFANGAFNKAKNYHQWRMNAFKEDQKKLQALVGRFQKQGLPVIVGGDLNIPHGRPLGNQVRYDAPRSLDYMMHTPSRHLHSDHGHVVKGFNSDHNEVVAGYTLTKGNIKA
jgi:hypothetical protein